MKHPGVREKKMTKDECEQYVQDCKADAQMTEQRASEILMIVSQGLTVSTSDAYVAEVLFENILMNKGDNCANS